MSRCPLLPSPGKPATPPDAQALTPVLNLFLAGLGGGHHGGSPLVDGARALLQAAQVGAVLVGLDLGGSGRPWACSPGQLRPMPGPARSLGLWTWVQLTLEAATSWAVLAAISWEQTMSCSYLPL